MNYCENCGLELDWILVEDYVWQGILYEVYECPNCGTRKGIPVVKEDADGTD